MAADMVMIVKAGIVAQTVIHEDGSEVLLGLYGPDQLLIPHPEDGCFIHLMAHTEVEAQLIPWAQVVSQPAFADPLRQRLRLMEAWSATLARPYLADRVLGLLTLLGEQFGVATANGLVVDVRITHAQIASAVGAVRSTVTRILGELRRRRLIVSVGSGDAERFCRLTWQESPHLSAHPSSRVSAPLHR
jgi:CRP-like cAMP-binding protein